MVDSGYCCVSSLIKPVLPVLLGLTLGKQPDSTTGLTNMRPPLDYKLIGNLIFLGVITFISWGLLVEYVFLPVLHMLGGGFRLMAYGWRT